MPTKINAPSHILEGLAQGVFRVPKMAIVIEVKDREAVAKALEMLVESANRTLRTVPRQPGGSPLARSSGSRVKTPVIVFSVNGPDIAMATRMRPTLLLGRKTLVIASSPAMAIQARDRNEGPLPAGLPAGDPLPVPRITPERLTFLSVDDTRQSILPELVVGLPGLAESLLKAQQFRGLPFRPAVRFPAGEADGAGAPRRAEFAQEGGGHRPRADPRSRRAAAIPVSVGPCAGRE